MLRRRSVGPPIRSPSWERGIKTELTQAIDTCTQAISGAAGMRFHKNPSGLGAFFSGVGNFVKDHVAGLAKLSGILKTISFVSGCLSFIPVIGEAAIVVSVATGAAALGIDAATMAATGNWNPTTLAIDGLALVPVAGKLARPLIESTRLSEAAAGSKAFASSLASDMKAVRFRVAATPDGTTMKVRDGKTAGQMMSDASDAAKAATARAAEAADESPPGVVRDWTQRNPDNDRGTVWQQRGAIGNANSIRIMNPNPQYPNGYVRFYNERGQPIGLDGKPGPNSATHIPRGPDGSYPLPKGWDR